MKFIPVLSFPVARKLGHSVGEFVKSADLQAETMAWIAHNAPVDAVLGPMDLSIEAEAFGATVRFSEDEVPAVTGQLVADEDDVAALGHPHAVRELEHLGAVDYAVVVVHYVRDVCVRARELRLAH